MFSKQPTKSESSKSPARLDAPPPSLSDGASTRKAPTVASLVAENLTVEGGITGEGELHIDGIVRGDVRIGKLTIGDTGHVEGSIFADAVEARGRVIGAITAKQVRLYGTCYIDGDITHEQLAMETGAFFQGRSLKFQRPSAPPAEAPAKPAPPALEAPATAPAASNSAPQAKPVF
ncbi:polymer-forming cytoskeletal protein [Phenylobacterium sp.]|jgi:cytoskeletal protein CcmA (bactofilin family)|uniref:bactofilin family protein n=1 Tax=Phenylobacterium sp. TaxID=1871053 RepID=UPI000C90651A|nr:polymer-forming cytoskeletal protein [Phenylobacterium sp.]MAK80872.1 cell shape determination protein CcmA [Phenylobacterium sp.]|tara:strand:- start:70646 stop:71173 length:528 start_codon:yes stop_codon:yes gene_type:complete